MPVNLEIGPPTSLPLARFLLLSVAVAEALAHVTSGLDVAAARQERKYRIATGAPGGTAYPGYALTIYLDDLAVWEKGFATLADPAPLSMLWRALAFEGELVMLVGAPWLAPAFASASPAWPSRSPS